MFVLPISGVCVAITTWSHEMVWPPALTDSGVSTTSSDSVCSKTCDPPPSMHLASPARYLRGWNLAWPSNATPGRPKNGTASRYVASNPSSAASAASSCRRGRVLRGIGVERGELVARHPRPPAIDAFGGHDGVDLDHGGQPRVPHRLRVIAAEVLDELREVGVGHAGDVRGRVPGVHASAAPAIDDGDRTARAFQQVRRGQAGDPGADHHDVDRESRLSAGYRDMDDESSQYGVPSS